jgi:hypothetical protein
MPAATRLAQPYEPPRQNYVNFSGFPTNNIHIIDKSHDAVPSGSWLGG